MALQLGSKQRSGKRNIAWSRGAFLFGCIGEDMRYDGGEKEGGYRKNPCEKVVEGIDVERRNWPHSNDIYVERTRQYEVRICLSIYLSPEIYTYPSIYRLLYYFSLQSLTKH